MKIEDREKIMQHSIWNHLGRLFLDRRSSIRNSRSSILYLPFLILALMAVAASANEPRPVPVMQAVPLPDQQISFQRDGFEIARYYFGSTLRRPFVYPIVGPSGRSLTRMGHPHDPESHSHHNSVWISHNDVNGLSFWGDRTKGRIAHQRVELLEDGDDRAAVITANAWVNETNNKVLLQERRRTEVRLLPNKEWMLILDLNFEAKDGDAVLGKTPFGLVGVRMAKTIGINDGGGELRNSEGENGEKGIFWKHARWVDYSGPITASATEGITLMDHPTNPNHPTGFHVRSDGWMGTSLTLDEARTISLGKPLNLRYGLYVHRGMPEIKSLQQRWEDFARTSPAEWKKKK